MRLYVDYRELNEKIIPNKMSAPRVRGVLDNLRGQSFFTILGMTKAYHQGFMSKQSTPLPLLPHLGYYMSEFAYPLHFRDA